MRGCEDATRRRGDEATRRGGDEAMLSHPRLIASPPNCKADLNHV